MMGPFVLFVATSILLLPFAWFVGVSDKLASPVEGNPKRRNWNIGLFIGIGPLILCMDMIGDIIYFWKNNFRSNLNKIIIVQEKSTITNRTLREIGMVCKQFSENKIKSVTSNALIKIFRLQFQVQQNIQFLMFG